VADRDMNGLMIFAVLYGLDWIATVPPTVNLTAQRFGRGSVGTIFGWVFCAHMVGASLASFAGGFFHDLLGSYTLVFLSAAGLGFVAVALSSSITRIAPRPLVEPAPTALSGEST
jgi:MFS family permease